MASKRSEVAELNNIVLEYLKLLGMSEEAKLDFERRAKFMEALGFHRSSWFHRVTAGLSQILHHIQQPPRPEIDLNEAPPPQHSRVEDEASSHALGKRKRVGSALRIRESKNSRPSHHHNNQVPPILLSDDSD